MPAATCANNWKHVPFWCNGSNHECHWTLHYFSYDDGYDVGHFDVLDITITIVGSAAAFCVMVGSDITPLGLSNVVATAIGSKVTFLNDVSYDVASSNASDLAIAINLPLDSKKKKIEDA